MPLINVLMGYSGLIGPELGKTRGRSGQYSSGINSTNQGVGRGLL